MPNHFDALFAVCSWSMEPADPKDLLAKLRETGVRRLQIALDPFRQNPAVWNVLPELCQAEGVELVSGMFGTVGEDYSTPESIKRTGGVVPDATWPQSWAHIQAAAEIAQRLKLNLVTFHAGFLPHEPSHPDYKKLLERVTQIADLFAAKHIELGFETGQETADTLDTFLRRLNKPNVGVNFDPANMILYDKGNPIDALRLLGPWVRQCHIKDAVKPKSPGAWGEEVVVGTGEVDWPAFLRVLGNLQFKGNLAIEREAGHQRVADIRTARQYLASL